jgi:hypothetical protein
LGSFSEGDIGAEHICQEEKKDKEKKERNKK